MFIKELNLKAFGKFLRKPVVLKNGLNLVYGNNEAGKSTIHNFIEMMFYGFRDNKNMPDETLAKKYRPWNNDQYLGAMTIDDDDKEVIIKRDFLYKDVNLFVKTLDGEKEIEDYNSEQEVGEYLFGINKATFSNTLSIKQLNNSTNEELATEVKEKIQNLSQTKNEDISVEKIVKQLSNIRDEIGDIENPKSLLSQYSTRVAELNAAKEKAIDLRKYTIHLAMEKKKLYGKIEELNQQIADINNELYDYKITVLAEKKSKIDEVYKEIEDLKIELEGCQNTKSISIDEYENAVKLLGILQQRREEKNKIEEEIEKLNQEMIELENDPSCSISAEGFVVKINLDYKYYKECEEKIFKCQRKVDEDLGEIKSYNNDEIAGFTEAYDKVTENNEKIDRNKALIDNSSKNVFGNLIKGYTGKTALFAVLGSLILFISVLSIYIGANASSIILYAGVVLGILAIILFVFVWKNNKKKSSLYGELAKVDSMEKVLKDEIETLNKENEKLFAERKCENFDELRDKSNYYVSLRSLVEEKLSQLEYDKGQLESIENKHKELEKELTDKLAMFNLKDINDASMQELNKIVLEKDKIVQELTKKSAVIDGLVQNLEVANKELNFEEKRFDIILKSNNIENINELKALINNNYKVDQIKDKISNLERVAQNLLENHSYDEIVEKTKELESNSDIATRAKNTNHKERFKDIANKEDEIKNITKEIEKLDREIDSTDDLAQKICEIEEEIDFYQDKIDQGKDKIKISEMAIENIRLIADLIKGDFMPILRTAISENFTYVTGGRYKDVRIDSDMNITVISSDDNEIVDLKSLSGGTLDQLYISLRLGLATLISNNKKIPLLLDDSFIQYDEDRLQKSLEILNKEKNRRQIILFTCQRREKTLLDKLGIEYNSIEIA